MPKKLKKTKNKKMLHYIIYWANNLNLGQHLKLYFSSLPTERS